MDLNIKAIAASVPNAHRAEVSWIARAYDCAGTLLDAIDHGGRPHGIDSDRDSDLVDTLAELELRTFVGLRFLGVSAHLLGA